MNEDSQTPEWHLPLGISACLAFAVGGFALYEHVQGGRYSDFAQSRAATFSRHAQSSATHAGAGHWSGSYQAFIGALDVGTDSFSFTEHHGCGVVPTGYDFGGVRELDGALEFEYFYGSTNRHMRDVYIPVLWKERAYLVGQEDLPEFCSMVNGGARLPIAMFWKENSGRPFTERATVPREFEKYLLPESVHAKTLAVGETEPGKILASHGLTRVTLDAGTSRGVLKGMRLSRCGNHFTEVEIESSSEQQSIGIINGFDQTNGPLVDWCFTTGGVESEFSGH